MIVEQNGGKNAETALSLYLKEVAKTRALSADEESRVARDIKKGNNAALQKLVRANLRFVISVAKNYQNQGVPLEDLINEGNVGLVKAAKKFDDTKNFKFISYAVWWIRQSILNALAAQSRITNIPLNRAAKIYRILKAQSTLEQKFRRLPDYEEIAAETGLSVRDVRNVCSIISTPTTSLNAPIQSEPGAEVVDMLCYEEQEMPDDGINAGSRHREVAQLLGNLTDREKDVIKLYFGIGTEVPCTLEDIGKQVHLTRERVRQLKENALRRLRHEYGVHSSPRRSRRRRKPSRLKLTVS